MTDIARASDGINVKLLFDSAFRPTMRSGVLNFEPPIDCKEYRMNHKKRGKCLIFNNKSFDEHLRVHPRKGTDLDASNLNYRFSNLGFEVTIFKNKTCADIQDILEQAGKDDHTDNDCIVVCMLSHGKEGYIYGKDGVLSLECVFAPFVENANKMLAGKPKLFFIQACQGDSIDHGVKVLYPDKSPIVELPNYKDFFVGYCSVPGYLSWRNPSKGSWFIQALCTTLERHGRTTDLLTVMTHVNHIVSVFQANVAKRKMRKAKQVPYIMSTLTGDVIFR